MLGTAAVLVVFCGQLVTQLSERAIEDRAREGEAAVQLVGDAEQHEGEGGQGEEGKEGKGCCCSGSSIIRRMQRMGLILLETRC